jgi:Spy/CpxP family protein refolding chaperone
MRKLALMASALLLAAALLSDSATAQPPQRGKGGPGGFGPPMQPGQILPAFLRERLKLTPEQAKQFDEIQKEVDEKLAKILTEAQRAKLKGMRGPGGPPPGKEKRG